MPPTKIVISIISCVAVIGGAYIATYYIGALSRKTRGAQRRIRIIDKCSLSKDKTLVVAETGGRAFFIAFSRQNAAILGEFDAAVFEHSADEDDISPPGRLARKMLKSFTRNIHDGSFADSLKSAGERGEGINSEK